MFSNKCVGNSNIDTKETSGYIKYKEKLEVKEFFFSFIWITPFGVISWTSSSIFLFYYKGLINNYTFMRVLIVFIWNV